MTVTNVSSEVPSQMLIDETQPAAALIAIKRRSAHFRFIRSSLFFFTLLGFVGFLAHSIEFVEFEITGRLDLDGPRWSRLVHWPQNLVINESITLSFAILLLLVFISGLGLVAIYREHLKLFTTFWIITFVFITFLIILQFRYDQYVRRLDNAFEVFVITYGVFAAYLALAGLFWTELRQIAKWKAAALEPIDV